MNDVNRGIQSDVPINMQRDTPSDLQRDTSTDIAQVLRLEAELLDPAVRSDAARLGAILHADFIEHGASGRVWTRQAIIDELPLEDEATPLTTATDLVGRHIADGTILVTYRTTSTLKTAIRSSLWLRSTAGEWQIRFHQGTPIPDEQHQA